MKKIFLLTIFVGINSYAMLPGEIEELYKLCQTCLQDAQIRTIAAYIGRLNKDSGVSHSGSMELRTAMAEAVLNVPEKMVAIHRIVFPNVTIPEPVMKISFDEMLHINSFITTKDKK